MGSIREDEGEGLVGSSDEKERLAALLLRRRKKGPKLPRRRCRPALPLLLPSRPSPSVALLAP